MKKERGITLVALVVTIIILLILAGVAIRVIAGDNGLIMRTKDARLQSEIAEHIEMLNMEEMELSTKLQRGGTLEEYIKHLEDKKIIFADETEKYNDGSYLIKLEDGCTFFLENKDGKITPSYQGKDGELLPQIVKVEVIEITSNTIKVQVEARRADKYHYSIGQDEKYGEKKVTTTLEFTFENLTQGQTYDIKVVAENSKGKVEQTIKGIITENLTDLAKSNITFSYSEEGWTNGDVTVTASTELTGYIIQTSKDGVNWESTDSQTLSENGAVYARLVDSTNQEGEGETATVDNIDKGIPTITGVSSNSNTIILQASEDLEKATSGINGYAVTEDETQPTDFTECESTNELSINIPGKTKDTQYYVWVKDEAGNISAVQPIRTTIVPKPTITADKEGWTNQNVTTTASTTQSGYTVQTSKDGENWTNIATQEFEANGTSYARLVDSTNQVSENETKPVSNIDKIPPSATTSAWYSSGHVWWNVYPSDTGGSGFNASATRFMMVKGQRGYVGHNPGSYHRPYSDLGGSFNSLGIDASRGQWCTLHMLLQDYAGNYFEVNSQYKG